MSQVHLTLDLNSQEPNERKLLVLLHGMALKVDSGEMTRNEMQVAIKHLLLAGTYLHDMDVTCVPRLAHHLAEQDKNPFLAKVLGIEPVVMPTQDAHVSPNQERGSMLSAKSARTTALSDHTSSSGNVLVSSPGGGGGMEEPEVVVNADPNMSLDNIDAYDAAARSGIF